MSRCIAVCICAFGFHGFAKAMKNSENFLDQLLRFDYTTGEDTFTTLLLLCGGLMGSKPIQVYVVADVIDCCSISPAHPGIYLALPEYPLRLELKSRSVDGREEPFMLTTGEAAKHLAMVASPADFVCLSLSEEAGDGVCSVATAVLKDHGRIGSMAPPELPLPKKKDEEGDVADRIEAAWLRSQDCNSKWSKNKCVPSDSETDGIMSEAERLVNKMLKMSELARKGKDPFGDDSDTAEDEPGSDHHAGGDEPVPPAVPPPPPPPPPPPESDAESAGSGGERVPRTDFVLLAATLGDRWLCKRVCTYTQLSQTNPSCPVRREESSNVQFRACVVRVRLLNVLNALCLVGCPLVESVLRS